MNTFLKIKEPDVMKKVPKVYFIAMKIARFLGWVAILLGTVAALLATAVDLGSKMLFSKVITASDEFVILWAYMGVAILVLMPIVVLLRQGKKRLVQWELLNKKIDETAEIIDDKDKKMYDGGWWIVLLLSTLSITLYYVVINEMYEYRLNFYMVELYLIGEPK